MRIFLSVIILFFANSLFCQSPYEVSWKKESFYFGTGAALYATAGILESKINPLTTSDILALDRSCINSFDRGATFNFSSNADRNSDYVKFSSHALPFLFLTHRKTRNDVKKIITLYGETLLITGGLTSLTKRIFLRPRPFVFNESVPFSDKQTNSARYSFFSGHTSISAANSIFAAKVFSDYFPDSKWKPLVWSVAVLVPVSTGYFRVKAGKHFPTDVITGAAIGGAIGYLVPHLHKKKSRKNLKITPTFSGAHISLTF